MKNIEETLGTRKHREKKINLKYSELILELIFQLRNISATKIHHSS